MPDGERDPFAEVLLIDGPCKDGTTSLYAKACVPGQDIEVPTDDLSSTVHYVITGVFPMRCMGCGGTHIRAIARFKPRVIA